MSVRGELTRSANLLLAFLAEQHPGSTKLEAAIAKARDSAKEDISQGAEEVLALEASGALSLPMPAEAAEEQEERLSHLLSIAHVILGR